MRPTFMGFETAKSGLNISQKGLDIVGNNLTNIDTAGYTRQRLDVTSIAPSSFSTRVATSRIGLTGQGVQALGVGQTRDEFLDKRFRDEYSTSGYYSQATSILSDIEYALGDAADVSLGGDVFTQALRQIYESLNDFSGSPTSTPHANLVLSAFTNATQVLQMLDDKLNDVAEQQVYDLGLAVDDVNTILAQIAELNKAISQDATVLQDPDNEYYRPNELLDRRNLLLDELAGYGDIRVTNFSDGTINVTMGGHEVVTKYEYDGILMNQNQDTDVVSLAWRSSGELLNLTSGSLLSYTDFINGRGNNVQNAGETTKQGILYYRDRLDTLARTLANAVNHVIPEMTEVTELLYETYSAQEVQGSIVQGDVLIYATSNPPEDYDTATILGYETDENGDLKLDDDGNAIPIYALKDGVKAELKYDDDGNLVTGYQGTVAGTPPTLTKTQGNVPIYQFQNPEYVLDPQGNKIVIGYEASENGTLDVSKPIYQTVPGTGVGPVLDKETGMPVILGYQTDLIYGDKKLGTVYADYEVDPTDPTKVVGVGAPLPDQGPLPIWDTNADGTIKVDANGKPVQKLGTPIDPGTGNPKLEQKRDEFGNLVYKELISAETGVNTTDINIPVDASNISVSEVWINGGAGYFLTDPGNKINSTYAEQLMNVLTGADVDFVSFGESFTGTFEEYVIDYTGKIGSDTAYYTNRQEVTASVADEYLNQRDAISAVSENEETVSMLTYQKSFNACSRLMTTLDDLLDTLINSTGRVGL